MSVAFLAPLAAALGLLVALPVLAHLARQVPRTRREFGAMLLLQRVVKRLRRRRRVKDLPLLLLRMALIACVAAAAMGPAVSWPGGTPKFGGSGRVVFVIDRSLSMGLSDGGSTLLARARDEASTRLRALPEGTLVGVVTFADHATRLSPSLTADTARLADRIGTIEPSFGRSNLRDGLLEARRLLGGEKGEVFVFSDEAGPGTITAATSELSLLVEGGSAVVPVPIHADPPRNIAVLSATYGDGDEGGQLALRVGSYGPNPVEAACEVTLPDGQVIPVFADVPAAGEVTERLTVPPEALGGVGKAWCDDKDLPADDTRYFHLPRVGASRVLVIDGDPGDSPTKSEVYFLERALAPWGGIRGGIRPDVSTPVGLQALDAEEHRVVFLANVADPRASGPALIDFVRRGGSLVIGMGDNVTAARYDEALGPILPAVLRKTRDLAAPAELGVPMVLPDTTHPLFAPFQRGGRGAFTKVSAHRVMTVDPYEDSDDVTTLLRWEGGAPALIERKVGTGRVLLWTSTFDLAWTNLPLQSAYMPLVQRMVAYLGAETGGGEGRLDALVDEIVSVPLPDLTLDPTVTGPDGTPFRSHLEGSQLLFTPDRPGAYTITVPDAPALAYVAVNTAATESDVRRFQGLAAVEQELVPELFRVKVDLSPWLLGAALLLAVLQALVALARPEPEPVGEPT